MQRIISSLLFLLIMGTVFSQARLDSGLVAYYPFNGNANDESGNENNGSVIGAVLTTDRSGNADAAYEFDGESTYISIPNSESLQAPTTELTELAWVNIYSWSLVSQAFGPVFMKSNSGDNQFQYRLSLGPDGINIAINQWDNYVTIADTLEFEKWYFVAATWKDDTARLYLDGTFIGKGLLSGPASFDNKPLEIGRDAPGGIEFFHGKIDEARIYSRALTDAEILAVYNGNTGISQNTDLSPSVVISPNPTRKVARIFIQNPKGRDVIFRIFNMNGAEVKALPFEHPGPGNYIRQLNIEDLSPGVYIYEVKTGNRAVRGKMVVSR